MKLACVVVSLVAVVSSLLAGRGAATARGESAGRRAAVAAAAKALGDAGALSGAPWADTRRALLGACGLADERAAAPGAGYTGHCFSDFNHVACCNMLDDQADNENRGQVANIAYHNRLGAGIRAASDPEKGPGGSWCTCALNANAPGGPADVCHRQFDARAGFYMVWCVESGFTTYTLVDDDGELLAAGSPTGRLPPLAERQSNYEVFRGSKYAAACADMHSLEL